MFPFRFERFRRAACRFGLARRGDFG